MNTNSAANSPPPVAPGDWVARREQHPQIAKVRKLYRDPINDEWLADLVLYGPDGERIGRDSPRMGGPAGFEPACPLQYWSPIRKPNFPLDRDHTGYRCWSGSLEYLDEVES